LWPAVPETVRLPPDATGLGETAHHEEDLETAPAPVVARPRIPITATTIRK
jgi:hypothetical protein